MRTLKKLILAIILPILNDASDLFLMLESLRPRDALYRFRFYAAELVDLAQALDIPDPFITQNRYKFSAVEALSTGGVFGQ
ncbi:hypothetical protein R3P38DRAFT_3493326 [Favolaschia claudopus]|uniref:Uncharacterized protein n=1 Tax=Favolaschia claudopus TaxID=2862362 RepID=A0AAW0C8V0_9AGAR